MNWIHEFWITNFPIFDDVYFVYYFLDVITIMMFFRIVFSVPSLILGIKKK